MTRPNKQLTIERLERALDQIQPLEQLEPGNTQFKVWFRDTRVAVEYAFGKDSKEAGEFASISFAPVRFITAIAIRDSYIGGLSTAEATLQSMISQIRDYWEDEAPHVPVNQRTTDPRDVFIVHGRDDGAREIVARFVEKLGLKAIVLAEVPSEGRTIIEKFEAHANVGYAIVLLTADDTGALEGEESRPRARQNVIFELGFFIGKLGRKYVCALTKGDPEVPSDYAGVAYIPMDGASQWEMSLIRELKAAGLDVDANKAFD